MAETQLTPLQKYVTQDCGTEPPFQNAYWDNHEAGIYVDVITGEPLFSSLDKFDSGTGWPSFTKVLEPAAVLTKEDRSYGMVRTEVRSKKSHLGHLFTDGPAPTGQRYCINSASLRFVPVAELEKQGYGRYLALFSASTAQIAVFAGGCFWGMEEYFRQLPGVLQTRVGYTGGHLKNPTYEEVVRHTTGHAEAIEIQFDAQKISYTTLLRHFFRVHDPTSLNRQGNDVGDNYRSAIFYENDEQKKQAQAQLALLATKLNRKVVTQLEPAQTFYAAEDYHQKYLQKNPGGYCHIDMGLLKKPLQP